LIADNRTDRATDTYAYRRTRCLFARTGATGQHDRNRDETSQYDATFELLHWNLFKV
jgi:hypothetical protein